MAHPFGFDYGDGNSSHFLNGSGSFVSASSGSSGTSGSTFLGNVFVPLIQGTIDIPDNYGLMLPNSFEIQLNSTINIGSGAVLEII